MFNLRSSGVSYFQVINISSPDYSMQSISNTPSCQARDVKKDKCTEYTGSKDSSRERK
jgi:hypothetical protein